MTGPALTARQIELHTAVVRSASSLDERMMLVGVLATRLGCSSADIDAVRAKLLGPIITRECGDLR
jgi:hypothetical protein